MKIFFARRAAPGKRKYVAPTVAEGVPVDRSIYNRVRRSMVILGRLGRTYLSRLVRSVAVIRV
jgi:hypothetical protein